MTNGTYMAVQLTNESANALEEFIKNNNIPNPLQKENLHVTIIYSRNALPELEASDSLYIGEAMGLTVWPTYAKRGKDSANALILLLDTADLIARHRSIMSSFKEATYDFDEYNPHITLSYNLGDFDINSLDIGSIPILSFQNEIIKEIDE